MGENRIAEPRPFIEELIEKIGSTISDLEEGQIHTFYEAIGEMISAANDPHTKESLIDKLMFLPNQTWAEIVKRASMDVNVLSDVDAMRHISTILKTNERTCAPVGQVFLAQLGNIYLDMLHVYKVYSEQISNTVQRDGARATTRYDMKAMRTVKCDVLKLVQTFVEKSNNIQPIMQNLLPPLLKPVLEDYRQAIPEARDPQVLALLAEIVNKCQKEIINDVPIILDAVFESTLNMITANFSDFPDHRVQFFKLLRAIINHCFEGTYLH
jgi:exportin-1